MSFSEVSIYQVKPEKVEEFQAVMESACEVIKASQGCQLVRLVRRTHYINDFSTIKNGAAPDKLTRIIKCVKFVLYSEFDSAENYGKAQRLLYETNWKEIENCLIVPHDKILGELLINK